MANNTITEIADNLGQTYSDQELKEEIIRQVIYTESGSLSVGTKLVGTQQMSQKGVEFTYPGEMTAEYDVGMDSQTQPQRIGWNDFDMSLKQAQVRYFLTDEAKLQGVSDVQLRMMRRRASEALARRKDENILGTLRDGAFAENDSAASNTWNGSNADIVDEIWAMWNDIMVNAPLSNMDMRNMALVVPAEIYTEVNKLELINNVQQRVKDYLGSAFGFSIYPTKLGMHDDDQINLQDEAILLLPGDTTAIHGELSAEAARAKGVPLVENERKYGKGEDYMVKQWYNTKVLQHESGNADESPRVARRTNVNANV